MAELALSLRKTNAPAGVKRRHAEPLAGVLAGGTLKAAQHHQVWQARTRVTKTGQVK
jgi:hypothetical protein